MSNHPASTPSYVTNAIPGAPELAAEFITLRAAHVAKAVAVRAAGEKAANLTSPHLHDPLREAKPGVKRADWERALDAYRVAKDELAASDRALDRAVRKFSDRIEDGRRTEAFKTHYDTIGEAAQKDAAEKLTALRAALTTRDEVNRWMGRQIADPTANGVSYTLREVTNYVDAVPTGRSYFREKALSLMADELLLPGDRSARLRTINELDARDDLTDAQKVAEYRTRTRRGQQ